MAHYRPVETDDSAIPTALRRFMHNRLLELAGLCLLAATLVLAVCLATWSADDPSWNNAIDAAPQNWFGYPGAVIADEFMQNFGLAVIAFLAIPIIWAINLLSHHRFIHPFSRIFAWLLSTLFAACVLSLFNVPQSWVLSVGLGGGVGDTMAETLRTILSLGLKGLFATFITFFVAGAGLGWSVSRAIDLRGDDIVLSSRVFGERGQDAVAQVIGALGHMSFRLRGALVNFRNAWITARRSADIKSPNIASSVAGQQAGWNIMGAGRSMLAALFSRSLWSSLIPGPAVGPRAAHQRVEPVLSSNTPKMANPPQPAPSQTASNEVDVDASQRVSPTAKPIKQSTRAKKANQPVFKFNDSGEFEMPSIALLAEPKKSARSTDLTDEALEQNARMLEGVLEDFGIRGEIINVRPGPVVTLYELEPAPGIKSSRVIGLADDIARSMSAISARVAVVPGRNAIGIELPNSTRETVYLREMLGSQAYENSKQNLALALGKNIGGEPIFADLTRMPHLLIAGTTGSGKSVGINTMILSLLYKHKPEDCKLIMIDPKMLELSVYEGIPHLLAPVVTDPRKARV
ncbi:MAG: DNA translocase FtsK 4TM domain-containing protein, partial [Aestuariivirgaceae bacterium]